MVRLVLEDADSLSGRRLDWTARSLFTFNDYTIEAFSALSFSDQELAAIGSSIIARLWAHHEKALGEHIPSDNA
jgi:hypothetical protein